MKKKTFVNALTLYLAIECKTYVNQERLQPKPKLNFNAKF